MITYNYLLQTMAQFNKLLTINFSSFKLSRNLMLLKKKIDSELAIYIELEKKVIDKYAKKDENGNAVISSDGIVEFDNDENKNAYIKEVTELKNTTLDGFEKVSIFEDNFRDKKDIPAPSDMLVLEELINWE